MDEEEIILFDMDSTLCDYVLAMKREYDKIKAPNERSFVDFAKLFPHEYNRKKLITHKPGWWANLPKYKPGFDILKIAKKLGFTIYILTKAPDHAPHVWTEKVRWIKKYIPEAKIIIAQDKSIVYGKVLVDDFPAYVGPWLKNRKRGLVIMPAHSWNKDFSHERAIRYTGKNLKQIKKALKRAKLRKRKEPLDISNI